ncbi:biliverdin-producing heme oxygenase [Chromatocurvus halotolerans]|uniref:Heme oxygenase n=1 Tax=Chromatocurvus halotolerans TaxID=1132028 RepID=A0A4R2KFL0_9GAMM|nr:biliverdin-producing heme oxygenase [Chromatocurvus halotolerans]TCO71854.1 heme oxygenase [Chromatocurvus halotolerans]
MNQVAQSRVESPLDKLKCDTAALHKAVERHLPFPASYESTESYARVLGVFHRFQLQVAAYTARYGSQVAAQLALTRRNRLPLIERDMRRLGIGTETACDNTANRPSLLLTSLDEFYGCLYVSEGSTLGGNIIQKAMLKMHGKTALEWTHYLNPYGQQIFPMWQTFRSVLNEEIATGNVALEEVTKGAIKSFDYILETAKTCGFSEKP